MLTRLDLDRPRLAAALEKLVADQSYRDTPLLDFFLQSFHRGTTIGRGLVDRDLARPAGQVSWHRPLCMVRAKVDA